MFEPDEAEAAAPAPPVPELDIAWEESTVRGVLVAQGQATHGLLAVDRESDEWVHTESDLRAIAPPLTRILNRYDVTRAAAGTGDELALLVGLAGYVTRSIRTRRESLALLREEDGPQPITGIQPTTGAGIGAAHPQEPTWTTAQ